MSKLNPTTVKSLEQAGDVAFDGTRARPVVAINDQGQLVVCCRRTAVKHGWKLEGTLHQRPRSEKKAVKTPAPQKKLVLDLMGDGKIKAVTDHTHRRSTDDASVEDLLK